MVKVLIFTFVICTSCTSAIAHASPIQTQPPKKGGALLEFPRGRFQENETPNFFKWSLRQKVNSVTLKIYRANFRAEYNPETDLISRYDFLPTVQSMTWSEEDIPAGDYVWVLEGYNETSPNAIYADSANFKIEPLKTFNVKTLRMGIIAGFSRGEYNSTDPNFKINFRTTPTTYGLLFSGGSSADIWEINGYMSDFVLRGAVHRTTTLYAGYFSQLKRANPNEMEIFWGPTVRGFQYPLVRSTDGTEIESEDLTVFAPGLSLKVQRQLDQHIMLHGHVGYDVAVVGSQNVEFGFDKGSYNVHFGMLYSLFWPLGFNGEFQYRFDQSATKDESDSLLFQQEQWSVVVNLIYAL